VAENVTLHLGDCLEYMKSLPDGCVDAVVTDPPYGFGKYEHDVEVDVLGTLVSHFDHVAVFGYPELLVKWCGVAQVYPNEWVTWWPTNRVNGRHNGSLPRESEAIAIWGHCPGPHRLFRERADHKWGRMRAVQRGLDPEKARLGDVWRDPAPGMACNCHLRQHPNEKPVSLMVNLIELCSNEGQTILDPFMGSGTTGVACVQTGRNFIGCEIDAGYFEIARKRIEQAQMQMRMPLEVAGNG
jgi:DNA modification methylase